MSTTYLIHLKGPGFSGRLVRYKILPPSEIQRLEENAAREITKTTTQLEYMHKINEMGRCSMITAVSEPVDVKQGDGETAADFQKRFNERYAAAKASMRLVDAGTLSLESETMFTTKDVAALKAIYDREHSVSPNELEAILGGKAAELED